MRADSSNPHTYIVMAGQDNNHALFKNLLRNEADEFVCFDVPTSAHPNGQQTLYTVDEDMHDDLLEYAKLATSEGKQLKKRARALQAVMDNESDDGACK